MPETLIPDAAALRATVARLDAAPDFRAAQAALKAMAEAIGMPVLAWSPDVAHPSFNPLMDAFLRREGWPDDVLTLWWDRSVMLKSPLYIRCRVLDTPFVTGVDDKLPRGRPELKRIAEAMAGLGVRSMITMPAHLPRGQVAMVSWGGPLTKASAAELMGRVRIELVAAAHLFMHAYRLATGDAHASGMELSRLTPREWECLRLTAQGCREDEVAALIGLAATTVRFHLDNVVAKLGAANRVHAVALAAQLGVLGPIS